MLKLSVSLGQAVQIGDTVIRLERKTSRSVHMLIETDRSIPVSLIKAPAPPKPSSGRVPLIPADGTYGLTGILQRRLKPGAE